MSPKLIHEIKTGKTLIYKLRQVVMSNRQKGILRSTLLHCWQAAHHGVELKHAVWVWKVCMFRHHCVALFVCLCECGKETDNESALTCVVQSCKSKALFCISASTPCSRRK